MNFRLFVGIFNKVLKVVSKLDFNHYGYFLVSALNANKIDASRHYIDSDPEKHKLRR